MRRGGGGLGALLALALWCVAAAGADGVRLVETGVGYAVIAYTPPDGAAPAAQVESALVGIPLDAEPRLEVLQAAGRVIPGTAPGAGLEGGARLAGPARLGSVGFVRDQRVVEVAFMPCDHGDGSWVVYDQTVVRVEFDGAGGGAAPADRWGERLLEQCVLNYQQARAWRRPRPVAAARLAAPLPATRARLRVRQEGIYRLTGAQLAAAGLPVVGVASDQLHLYYGGGLPLPEDSRGIALAEAPMLVEDGGDGVFGADDAVLFHGEPASRWTWSAADSAYRYLQNLYTRDNVYWLGVGGATAGLRAGVSSSAAVSSPVAAIRTCRARLHQEHEQYIAVQTHDISSGYAWYWESFAGNARRYPLLLPEAASDTVDLGIGFHTPGTERATLDVRWNDQTVRAVSVPASGFWQARVRSTGTVRAATNYLGLYHTGGGSTRLDYLEAEYRRRLVATAGVLQFDGPSGSGPAEFVLAGFAGQTPRIFEVGAGLREITDPSREGAAPADTVRFRDELRARPGRYLAVTSGNWLEPETIELDGGQDLRGLQGGAQYLVVTHGDFAASAARLAAWRAADSRFGAPLQSRVVDIQDVYDAFSGGLLDPTALRAFLRHAVEQWSPAPSFVLLLGDGTYDYKNNSGASPGMWIPAYQDNESTYDEWFVCVSGDDILPDMAIGRLPVQTAADADFVVGRLIGYDRDPPDGPWQARGLLVADDLRNPNQPEVTELYFLNDAEHLARRFMSQELDLRKLYLAQYPLEGQAKPRARAEFLRRFNEGNLYVTYVGHGNPDVLAHEHLFVVSRDLTAVANGKRLPFFFTAASQIGVFDDPARLSMPEALLLRRGGGVIGMISATRVGYHESNMWLANQFHERLFRGAARHVPVGLALLAAKVAVQVPDPGDNQINIRRYSLFGDPAQYLALPPRGVTVALPDTMRALAEVAVTGQVLDPAGAPVDDFDGFAWVQAFDSSVNSKLDGYSYQQLGAPLFRGVCPVRQGRFAATFRVPKDITYRGTNGRASAYVWDGDGPPAFGSTRGVVMAGTAAGGTADVTGPRICLQVTRPDSGAAGDAVGPNCVLRVTLNDPGGINITGETGHEIELTVDGQTTAITEAFSVAGDYRQGSLEYALEGLLPGSHLVAVKAWDSYNNSAEVEIQVQVSGRPELILTDLLFHPNPLRAGAGQFTFDLALPVEQVTIRVFALSGRLVDELTSAAQVGFNQVAWQPPAGLANGAYPYQVEAAREDGSRLRATGVLQVLR